MKRINFVFSLFLLFFLFNPVLGQEQKKEIIFFYSPSCPHCSTEESFLKEMETKYPDLEISKYELSKHLEKANALYDQHDIDKNLRGLVPITFIGDDFFLGFNPNISIEIENKLQGISGDSSETIIKIPFIGERDVLKFSMPVLTIILGIIDGFNVCSLGALVVILGLVMVLRSRKTILLLGGAFIFITALTYGFLIFLWHQFFVFISPYIKSMEIFIALLSLVGGFYLLREFIKSYKRGPSCSSSPNIVSRLSSKVEKMFGSKKSLLVLLGVVVLFALVITIVEFPCSALLPVLFANLLVEGQYSLGASLMYMALFLLFYMLDEIIIFLIAFFTLRIKIVSPKFINTFNLIAALIFLLLGSFYIYRLL